MQRAKIWQNSLKAKHRLLRKGKSSHLLALGVLGLWFGEEEILRLFVLHLWVLLVQVRKKKKRKLGGVFKKILRRRKKRKRVEHDVFGK